MGNNFCTTRHEEGEGVELVGFFNPGQPLLEKAGYYYLAGQLKQDNRGNLVATGVAEISREEAERIRLSPGFRLNMNTSKQAIEIRK